MRTSLSRVSRRGAAPSEPIDVPTTAGGSTAPPPRSTSSSSPSRPVPPPISSKRSFLSKLPVKQLKRIPGPKRIARRRQTLFDPLVEGDQPLGTLVIRVHAGRDLVAKDKNGLSDPYVVIRYGPSRVTGPTVQKSLNPVWGSGGESGDLSGVAGEAKLELKLHDCLALGQERVEVVCWDKDRVGSEYLGELSLGLDEWWGSDRTQWKDGQPPVGLHDSENKPVWHTLRSSRSRSTVSGALLVQVGFVPAEAGTERRLSAPQRERILSALRRIADEQEHARRASREERVFLAAPTETVGTSPADDLAPLGDTIPDPDSDSSDSSDGSTASGEESDSGSEEADDDASTSADEDELATTGAPSRGYFDLPPATTPLATSPATTVQSPMPDIVVQDHAAPTAAAPAAQQGRRGLSLPGFVKRRFSTQSGSASPAASSSLSLASTQPSTPSAIGESDLEGGASSSGAGATGKTRSKRRFARRRGGGNNNSGDTSDAASGIADDIVEMSLLAGGIGLSPANTPGLERAAAGGARRHRRHRSSGSKKGKKRRSAAAKARLRTGSAAAGFTYDDDEAIAGLVQVEIASARDLPRLKNALRTSYDMDPFCVISFGKKIFRTRVIRHSLNPEWHERLWFHVGEAETHWTIGFTVSDWDKISGNDHVGDVAVPLEQLLGTSIQHDERGLYPAGRDGKLVGDDFHEHELPLVMGDKMDKEANGAKPTLTIRAKYTPYAALRQQFWRVYAADYDLAANGTLSQVELFSMLDSLGSTLTKETLDSFFTRYGKNPSSDELTVEEVVLCLEEEVRKPKEERHHVDEDTGTDTGMNTPVGPARGPGAGDFVEMQQLEPGEYEGGTDLSSDMKTIAPGTDVLTDAEKGTVVTAPAPHAMAKEPSRSGSMEPSSDEGSPGSNIERVINIKECPLCRKPRLNKKGEVSIITHLGVCASTDPTKVNRVLVTNFVTASQAQRKLLNKVFSKVMKGKYNLGADSANIIVQDRLTGALQEEKMAVYVRLGIRLMYKGMSGNMEGARIRRLLDSLTKKQGAKYDSPASAREIEPFIKFHNLNMEEVLDPISSFKTFNEFFYRKLKPDARPVADPDDPRTVVSAADCRAMFFDTVSDATSIWIKGREFTVAKMLGDYYKDKAPAYEGGSLAIFRLAPQDYHRFHSPVDGVMGHQEYITGQYYTVNPMAIRSNVSVYSENVRLVASIDSPIFGEVMNVWVGAMMVAGITMHKFEGEEVKRGDDLGRFSFGGSTTVILFKPNTVKFDADLLDNSRNSIETLVRVGMRIGRAVEK
ncbi:phosphatidylserine decarboxylase-domain-containing protein [Rhodotorula diobovata]|uniref:Phosphatidylserine decarboxylase proenzyme 2 n=1 Tax=Rhodotorula diobovata TaxID=5288 RepID=A0A5C5FM53_9BASI|nr:phosphatidylserine decarboxylase-domain-containing protein [Rhodotorula diobovata]